MIANLNFIFIRLEKVNHWLTKQIRRQWLTIFGSLCKHGLGATRRATHTAGDWWVFDVPSAWVAPRLSQDALRRPTKRVWARLQASCALVRSSNMPQVHRDCVAIELPQSVALRAILATCPLPGPRVGGERQIVEFPQRPHRLLWGEPAYQ